jgi:hypothetical protein
MGVTADNGVFNAVDLYKIASPTTAFVSPLTTAAVAPSTTAAAAPSPTAAAAPSTSVSGALTAAAAAPSTSAAVGVAVGASVGGVVCVVLLVAAVWRWRKYLSQVHSCSTLVRGFVPCS